MPDSTARKISFWESIRMPLPAVFSVFIILSSVAVGLSVLRGGLESPIDVTWVYYANTLAVYCIWVGSCLVFGLFALRRPTTYKPAIPQTRFLCLIPAYNEAHVIRNSVVSILNQDYPRSLFEVVVVFDGTDDTDRVAGSLGARVLKTPTPASGKHRALGYAFRQLLKPEDDRFVCVFDADNTANSEFLQRMNDAIVNGGHRCLQGYHGVLNAQDNWVTKALWCATTASSRLYNLGRFNSIRNALICGTGWCCQSQLLLDYWPQVCTQTEDIELNGRLLLNEGVRVAWVTGAHMYDEKPQRLWVAVCQRRRWMAGHMRTCMFLGWQCLRAALKNKDFALFEIAFYYTVPFIMSLSVIQLIVIVGGIYMDAFHIVGPLSSVPAQLSLNLMTLIYVLVYQFVGFGLETRQWPRGILYSVYTMIFSAVVWSMALVWSWFSLGRRDWMSHTPHVAGVQEALVTGRKTGQA